MIRFSSNLSTMFQGLPFRDRFSAASLAGFDAIETWFPYDVPAPEMRDLMRRHNLRCVAINSSAGDVQGGDWGLAADPSRIEEFRFSVRQAFAYANAIECRNVHVMAGNIAPGCTRSEAWATYTVNLRLACAEALPLGLTVMIEQLNAIDRPNYLLQTQGQARRAIEELARPNLKIMLDIYHLQRGEGNLLENLRASLPHAAHVQIADNPGRQEPGTGEINFPLVFSEIRKSGYGKYVGCEFFPMAQEYEVMPILRQLATS